MSQQPVTSSNVEPEDALWHIKESSAMAVVDEEEIASPKDTTGSPSGDSKHCGSTTHTSSGTALTSSSRASGASTGSREHLWHRVNIDLRRGCYKSVLCRNYTMTGTCPYVARCVFAHGQGELRFASQNFADGLTNMEAIDRHIQREGMQSSPQSNHVPTMMVPMVSVPHMGYDGMAYPSAPRYAYPSAHNGTNMVPMMMPIMAPPPSQHMGNPYPQPMVYWR